jgi:hypothetical protein
MAHWAELDENNVVTRVLVGDNDDPNNDEGYQWILDNLGGTWVKTSYNAIAGKRRDPETNEITNEEGFRKNYAGIGYTWDGTGFAAPKPYNSWTLDLETYIWNAPTVCPVVEGKSYVWDEPTLSWVEAVQPA